MKVSCRHIVLIGAAFVSGSEAMQVLSSVRAGANRLRNKLIDHISRTNRYRSSVPDAWLDARSPVSDQWIDDEIKKTETKWKQVEKLRKNQISKRRAPKYDFVSAFTNDRDRSITFFSQDQVNRVIAAAMPGAVRLFRAEEQESREDQKENIRTSNAVDFRAAVGRMVSYKPTKREVKAIEIFWEGIDQKVSEFDAWVEKFLTNETRSVSYKKTTETRILQTRHQKVEEFLARCDKLASEETFECPLDSSTTFFLLPSQQEDISEKFWSILPPVLARVFGAIKPNDSMRLEPNNKMNELLDHVYRTLLPKPRECDIIHKVLLQEPKTTVDDAMETAGLVDENRRMLFFNAFEKVLFSHPSSRREQKRLVMQAMGNVERLEPRESEFLQSVNLRKAKMPSRFWRERNGDAEILRNTRYLFLFDPTAEDTASYWSYRLYNWSYFGRFNKYLQDQVEYAVGTSEENLNGGDDDKKTEKQAGLSDEDRRVLFFNAYAKFLFTKLGFLDWDISAQKTVVQRAMFGDKLKPLKPHEEEFFIAVKQRLADFERYHWHKECRYDTLEFFQRGHYYMLFGRTDEEMTKKVPAYVWFQTFRAHFCEWVEQTDFQTLAEKMFVDARTPAGKLDTKIINLGTSKDKKAREVGSDQAKKETSRFVSNSLL